MPSATRAEASLRCQRYRLGLSVVGVLACSGTVDEIVEPVDGTLAAIGNQLNFALVAGLEPRRGG